MAGKEISLRINIEGISSEAAELSKLEIQLKALNEERAKFLKQSASKGMISNEDRLILAAYDRDVKQTTESIKGLKKVVDSAPDSLNRMRQTLIEMKNEYANASEAVRVKMAPAINKLNDEILKSERSIGTHQRNVGNYPTVFKNAANGVLHFIGISAGIAGVIEIGKKAIESTEGATDKFELTMASLDGTTQGFFRTITMGDWSNFIKNMKDSAAAARDLKAAQQEFEHIATGNEIAINELTFRLNELKNAAAEEMDPGEKKKILAEAIDVQRQITSIRVSEAEKRAGIDEEYYRKQADRDEEYWNQFMDRVPEISKSYEMQFSLLDGYKKRLEQLKYLQLSQVGGLTDAQEKERHYYQMLVYNLEDFQKLQEEVGKAGKWDAFLKELGQVTQEASDGEAALRRMLSQMTRAGVNEAKSGKLLTISGVTGNVNDQVLKAGTDTQTDFEKEADKQYEEVRVNEDRILNDALDRITEEERSKKEANDREVSAYQDKENKKKEAADKVLQGVSAGVQAGFDFKRSKLQSEMEAELSNTNLTEQQRTAIKKKYAKEQQRIDVQQAIANGAAAILKNIAQVGFLLAIPLNILTAVQTAIQIATIKSQKYETGGKIRGGLPVYIPNSKDNLLIAVNSNEAVINERQIAALGGTRAMKAAGIPGFADGGAVSNMPYVAPSQMSSLNNNIQGMSDRIGKLEVVLDIHKVRSALSETDVILQSQKI